MKDPAFLFYSSDWITGTLTMSFEDKGKYITLLALIHQQGRINEETIRFIVGSVSDKLKSKFTIDEQGNWYNARLESEIEKRASFTESRRLNGKLGGRPTKEKPTENLKETKEKPIGYPTQNLVEDVNKNEIIDFVLNEEGVENAEILEWPTFDDFWDAYDKKVDRKVCMPKWNKLNQSDKEKVMAFIPNYILSTPDKKYRKDPETFLNRASWENEIIISNGKDTKTGNDNTNFRASIADLIGNRNYND